MEQRVILSKKDIERICSLGYSLKDFAVFRDGYWFLREYGGKCIFYDVENRKCRIYPYRPNTCRLYPLVYEKGNVYLDIVNCPEAKKIDEESLWDVVPMLIEHVFDIKKGYDGDE